MLENPVHVALIGSVRQLFSFVDGGISGAASKIVGSSRAFGAECLDFFVSRTLLGFSFPQIVRRARPFLRIG